jgi:hypothetical protein
MTIERVANPDEHGKSYAQPCQILKAPKKGNLMCMNNSLICFGVNELYQEAKMQQERRTLPTLCLFELTEEVQSIIDDKHILMAENDLSEVVVRTTLAKWYFQLTNRYHHEVTTFLHIRADGIAFSGFQRPFKQAHFSTPYILLKDLKTSDLAIKPIRLKQLSMPFALGLVKQIKELNKKIEELSDLYWGLDAVSSSIRDLDESVANKLTIDCDKTIYQISAQSNTLNAEQEAVELEVDNLLRRLMKHVFDISKGDWISYICPVTSKLTQLSFETCYFHANTITILGIGVTKAGILGKREQSIRIELVP